MSVLSAKNLKFTLDISKSFKRVALKLETVPLAIKFCTLLLLFKKISIVEFKKPSLTLLLSKVFIFEGFIRSFKFFTLVISKSFIENLIFCIFGFDFINEIKSIYNFIFLIGILKFL